MMSNGISYLCKICELIFDTEEKRNYHVFHKHVNPPMQFCKRCNKEVLTHDEGSSDTSIGITCNECGLTVCILYD